MTLSVTNVAVIAACNAIVDLVDADAADGLVKIYDGSVPTDADTALSGNTLLVTIPFAVTAFGNATDNTAKATATANALDTGVTAVATGTASFFRVTDGADVVIWQGAVGTSGAEINLNTVSIVTSGVVEITAMTFNVPE